MPSNHIDSQLGFDCWLDPNSEDDPDETEYSDNVEELRARALTLQKGGRYKYLSLQRWNAITDDWEEIETYP